MANGNWQGIVSGALIGLGIGVGVGMLLAPKAGKDTRDQLVGTLKDGFDSAMAAGQDVSRRTQRTIDDAKDLVKGASEAAGNAYREVKSRAS